MFDFDCALGFRFWSESRRLHKYQPTCFLAVFPVSLPIGAKLVTRLTQSPLCFLSVRSGASCRLQRIRIWSVATDPCGPDRNWKKKLWPQLFRFFFFFCQSHWGGNIRSVWDWRNENWEAFSGSVIVSCHHTDGVTMAWEQGLLASAPAQLKQQAAEAGAETLHPGFSHSPRPL